MQCPNCGRNVRSKTQCAHCGHVFDKKEVRETQQHDTESYEDYSPRKKSGAGKFLAAILKLVVAVALVFLAFLYGPQIINQVVEYFQPSDSQVVNNQPEQRPDADLALVSSESEGAENESNPLTSEASEEATASVSSLVLSEAQSESTDNDQPSSERETANSSSEDASDSISQESESADGSESEAEERPKLILAGSDVDLSQYPQITIQMDFDGDLNEVDSETFTFNVETNGNTETLGSDYSLVKDEQSLSISYNDPALTILSTEPTKQSLKVLAENLDFEEEISYELPEVEVDGAYADEMNQIIEDGLANQGDLSLALSSNEADVPYIYNDQSQNAGSLISWFIIAQTFDSVSDGELTLEDSFALQEELMVANDNGEIVLGESGQEFTLIAYIIDVINNGSVTAMNHLIQANGGPNEFNLWLNESNFFATRVTQLLGRNEAGQLEGALTNVKDVNALLNALAENQLISENLDMQFKELLLNSPITEKFPSELASTMERRYEIASSDEANNYQYYSGIYEDAEGYQTVVLMQPNISEPENAVANISQTIAALIGQLSGNPVVTEEEDEESNEEEVAEDTLSNPQVQIIDEEANTQLPNNPEGSFTSETGITYGPDNNGDGFYDSYLNAAGEYVPIEWSQGADGLWYFNETSY